MSHPGIYIRSEAYKKVITHAAKFPYNPTLGILAGTPPKPNGSGRVVIGYAFPLAHSWPTLTPMLEVALAQVSRVAASDTCGTLPTLLFPHGSLWHPVVSRLSFLKWGLLSVSSHGPVANLPYPVCNGSLSSSLFILLDVKRTFNLRRAGGGCDLDRIEGLGDPIELDVQLMKVLKVRNHLQSLAEDVQVLGFYYGSDRLQPYNDRSNDPSPPLPTLLEAVVGRDLPPALKPSPSMPPFKVNPNYLTLAAGENPLECYFYDQASKRWQSHPLAAKPAGGRVGVVLLADPAVVPETLKALREGNFPKGVYDFDEHLQDPSLPWLTDTTLVVQFAGLPTHLPPEVLHQELMDSL
ncbi:hypothetical protein L0F63_005119, partial [Massospora cicadina]